MRDSSEVLAEPGDTVGLSAAAAERQGAADAAQGADWESGAEGGAGPESGGTGGVEWRGAVELAMDLADGWMVGWCPGWEPARGATREAGISAWARYLDTVAAAPTPLQQALAFTAGRYAHPLYLGWQARKLRQADGDGEDAQR